MTFQQWLKELDTHFTRHFGLGHDDFPDYLWYDEYEADCDPLDSFEEWRLQTEDGSL